MEFRLSYVSRVAAILFVTIIAFLLQIMKRKRVNREPPKAKGAWPIIGHLHLLGGSQLPHHVLSDMGDKNGPIFTMKLGIYRVLVVSNSAIAKECYTTNDRIFASRPKTMAAEIMGYNYAMIGVSPYGDYWRQVRKMLTLKVLSKRRVEMLEHVRVSELKASMKDLYETWIKNKESEGSDMVKIEMSGWFGNLILNVVLGVLSGKRFPLSNKKGARSLKAIKDLFELFGKFVVSDFIPLLSVLDLGGYKKKMKMVGKEIDNILEGWLKEHKRERASEKQHEGNQVFIDVIISILQEASDEEFPGHDHDTVIKASCLAVLLGGSDTTIVTLTWALSLLLNSPNTMKTVQDEIDEHVGGERLVKQSDTKKLVYLQAVIKETLRLHPPGPLAIPHESMEDCVVSGYNIPKGTRLLVNIWKLHHDPNVWSDPYEFQPERFLTSQKDIDLKGNHFELLPFGSGRRSCPGMFFALEALPLTLASVLQQFTITKTTDEPIDMTEGMGLTTHRATSLEVHIAPRLSLNMYSTGA
ncbi:demethylepipodophyllotoxin synthase-like [Bidens hawaiensis]|uniref:demethylepipodophyllotoxin synthase-like n=1 Tax=Bidens hawaiensis TaxID=980011 RepID=UPI00404A0ACD